MANSAWQATIQNDAGDIVPAAEITVLHEATGLPATIFSSLGGAGKTNPFPADSKGFAQFYAAAGTYRIIAEDTGTGQTSTHRYIRLGDAASRDEGLSAGQLMEVGAFGLGGNESPVLPSDNADTLTVAGSYKTGTSWVGSPIAGTSNDNQGVLTYDAWFGGYGVQTFKDINSGKIISSRRVFGGVWYPWQEIFHTGNLNPNVFGGHAANDTLAVGYAESATLALFYLPISLMSPPSSFTQAGTFTIKKTNGFADVASGLAISSMGGLTSNKYMILVVSSLSGMVGGESLMLMSESSTSKITVNP